MLQSTVINGYFLFSRSPGFLFSLKKLLHINEKGLYSYFNDNEEFLPFLGTSARVNDGLWHSVAVSWQNNTGTLQLILDDDVHSKRVNHAAGKILSNEYVIHVNFFFYFDHFSKNIFSVYFLIIIFVKYVKHTVVR